MVNGVPTILVVGVVYTSNTCWIGGFPQGCEYTTVQVFSGTYSPSLAAGILNGTVTNNNVSLQWTVGSVAWRAEMDGTQVPVCCGHLPLPAVNGTAIAASPDGKAIYVAASLNGSSYVFESTNFGVNWTALTSGGGISGWDPQIAFGGAALLLVTHTRAALNTATFYLSGITTTTNTIAANPLHDAATWYPTAGMGEECLFVTTPSNQIWLYSSLDGGHTFSSQEVANYSSSTANSTVFASIGDTRIGGFDGEPGEISATVEGSTLFLLFTTEVASQTDVATSISANGGSKWTPPGLTALTNASIVNPSISSSVEGYVYATWLDDQRGAWTLDAAEYAEDGRLIAGPAPLPGTTQGAWTPNAYTTVTVDAFGRPFYGVSIPLTLSTLVCPSGMTCPVTNEQTFRYTAAYLSPSNALSMLQTHLGELSTWDFKAGTNWTLGSSLNSMTTTAKDYVQNYSSSKHSHYLCQAQNETANSIYTNITHFELGYTAGPTVCGNFGYAIYETTGSDINGLATPPPNYAFTQTVAFSFGTQTANTFLGTLGDWALESLGVPIPYSADPLRGFNPITDVVPSLASVISASAVYDSKTEWVDVTPTALNPTTGELVTTASFPNIASTPWYVGRCANQNDLDYYASANGTSYQQSVSVENNSGRLATTSIENAYLTNLTPNATIHWNATHRASDKPPRPPTLPYPSLS